MAKTWIKPQKQIMSKYIFKTVGINNISFTFWVNWRPDLEMPFVEIVDTSRAPGLTSGLQGSWMSIVVLYCWCHSDSASVLFYFTLVHYDRLLLVQYIIRIIHYYIHVYFDIQSERRGDNGRHHGSVCIWRDGVNFRVQRLYWPGDVL